MKITKFKKIVPRTAASAAAADAPAAEVCAAGDAMAQVKEIYMEAFPESERRDWADLVARVASGQIECHAAMDAGRVAAFVTVWRLPRTGWAYIEHLAVSSAMRGSGLGAEVMRALQQGLSCPVVLEVEPATDGEMARRRIGFYERLGFTAHHDHHYVQPPYSPGLPQVPLTLMTWGHPTPPLDELHSELLAQVYGA